jgi:hypothetical protein
MKNQSPRYSLNRGFTVYSYNQYLIYFFIFIYIVQLQYEYGLQW